MSTQPQYEIEAREATEATVRVTLGQDEFTKCLDGVYRRYAREVRIPGFRKGHIPRNVLESRFGRDAFLDETREELERKHLPEALIALDLRPVSRPRVEVVSAGEPDPFVFTASFSVLPAIELPDIARREVAVPPAPPVTDDDVARALAEVQSQFATLDEKDGESVSEGDIVRVQEGEEEWDTRVDGEHPVTKTLIGADVGADVAIDAELEDGKRFETTLRVVSLRQVVLPKIDDELAKDAGFDSLEALKKDIDEKLTLAREGRHRQLVETAVLDQIVDEVGIPLPAPFLDDLVNEEVERIQASFEQPGSGTTFEAYLAERQMTEEQLREEVGTAVERRLRRELVLRRVAVEREIRIEDDEMEELARSDAEAAGEDPLRFVGRLKAEDRWNDYRTSKINERVLALLRESAVVTATSGESTQGLVIDPTKGRSSRGLVIDPSKEGEGT